jgi:hypothetical protein
MKKMLAVVFMVCGLAALYPQNAIIRGISGTVEVKLPGSADWVKAAAGQRIDKSTIISTGFKSTALVALGNSVLTVRPLTRLSLEELAVASSGDAQVTLNLQSGRVRADVKPPENGRINFTVRSPTATASVRGTSFEFDGSTLTVREGLVHVSGSDRSGAYVGAGHEVRVSAETGKVAVVTEALQEALAPSLPAGVDRVTEIKAPPPSSSPPSAPSSPPAADGGIGLDFGWD